MRSVLRGALILGLAIAAAGGAVAQQQSAANLSGVTTTATGAWVPTGGSSVVRVEITSTSSSAATVVIEQSLDGVHATVVASEVNPNVLGQIWVGPSAPYTRTRVSSYGLGTLSSWITSGGAKAVKAWQRIRFPTGTATPTPYPTPTPTPTQTPIPPTPTVTPTPGG